MATSFLNGCIWTAASGGTGTFTVSAAVSPYFTPAQCTNPAVVDGGTYNYFAINGSQYEIGAGVYTASGTTLTRAAIKASSNGGAAVNFISAPTVHMGGPLADDITAAGRALLDDADAAAQRTTLGLGSIATFNEATDAEFRQNTSGKALSTDKVWSAAGTHETMADGATVTPDFNYLDHDITIAGTGRTLANPTNIKVGQKGTIYITQDGTGGRTITGWGTYYKFINGNKPTLTTTAGARDRITYDVVSSTQIDCFFGGNMS